uniref:Uncharacterized protein n=1 Tax=Lactuca sativa TaxID=4236 RepID=A0A9R1X655_LACSA|nr:hypothetical protein LSAT_V11C600300850 [Lactuca sativa]
MENARAIMKKPLECNQGRKATKGRRTKNERCDTRRYLDQKAGIGSTPPYQTRGKLLNLIRKYKHVFAWEQTDKVRISREVIEHNMNVKPGNTVVKQKMRGYAGDRNKVINIKVEKIIRASILREAIFPS